MNIYKRKAVSLFLLTFLTLTVMFVNLGVTSPQTTIYVEPPSTVVEPSQIFTVDVAVTDAPNFNDFEFWLYYDTTLLDALSADAYPPFVGTVEINDTYGYVWVDGWVPESLHGDVKLAWIEFHCIGRGMSDLTIVDPVLTVDGTPIAYPEPIGGVVVQTVMYWKPPQVDYAPSGMPDFSQKQDNWGKYYDTNITWTWCGPTAVANSLWWLDSWYEIGKIPPPTIYDTFPLVQSYNATVWDDHAPQNVPPLIEELAWYMNCDGIRTDPCAWDGTFVDDMTNGINEYIRDKGLEGSLYARMVEMPDFYFIEHEVERCEDVILLVGFWQLGEMKDQYQEICKECELVGDPSSPSWQQFVPRANSLSRVEVRIARTLGKPNMAPITMTIESPLGVVLTNATLPPEEVPELPFCETEWVSFDVPDIPLIPLQSYYIVLKTEPGFYYHWCGAYGNPYPLGESNFPDWDWTFRTFYRGWRRLGGHYLTVAGVDSEAWILAVSDPYGDWAEPPAYPGDPDRGKGPGRVIPPPPHGHPTQPPSPTVPDTVHNNATYISHDMYKVTPSESPGGIWQLEDYISSREELVENMAGQNCPREFLSYVGEQVPGEPIYTEIEYAVVVSPPILNWPMFRHDLRHTGYSPSPAPTTNTTIWNYTTGGYVVSSPAVADGMVFVGSYDGNVYALDEFSGAWIWNYTTGSMVESSPAVADGMVFIGSDDHKVYAFGLGVHDVAVIDVMSHKTVVGQGYNDRINVTVANEGDFTETFNVTTYYNGTIFSDGFESGQKPQWTYYAQNPDGSAVTEINDDIYKETPTHSLYIRNLYGNWWGENNGIAYAVLNITQLPLTIPYTIEFWFYPNQSTYYPYYNGWKIFATDQDIGIYLHDDPPCILLRDEIGEYPISYPSFAFQSWHKINYTRTGANSYVLQIDNYTYTGDPHGDSLSDVSTTLTLGDTSSICWKGEAYWDDIIISVLRAPIESKTVTLTSGNSTIITFTWDTTGVAKGNYTISAVADTVPSETDLDDNTLIDGTVMIVIPGDINADKTVNILDAILLARYFGSSQNVPGYNPNADINCDGTINILDAIILARHFGETDC